MVPPEPDAESHPDLNDDALVEEITLLGDMIVAASTEPSHLTETQVDSALGLADEPAGTVPRRELEDPPLLDGPEPAAG